MKLKEIFLIPLILYVGYKCQEAILDEIKPNRFRTTWYGLPYYGGTKE